MSSFEIEHELINQGYKVICGIDEAGRGPFAGPVVAAAVVLPIDCEILGLDDSKKIKSEKKRKLLAEKVKEVAIGYGIGEVSSEEIDQINILNATFKAMRQAVDNLQIKPDFLLIDGDKSRGFDDFPNKPIVKGDSLSLSISAASILAKVYRDDYINEQAKLYPQFSFEKHKGYGTKLHTEEILKNGPCPIHRRTFLRKLREKYNCDWE